MAHPGNSDEVCLEAMRLMDKHNGNAVQAANEAGCSRHTVASRAKQGEERGLSLDKNEFTLPDFPDDDLPVDDIIDLMTNRFEIRKEADDARKWFPVSFKKDQPIGIVWFGDPHTDDNGCNWPQLRKDIDVCKDTPGVYGINIGDTTNNWAGRLAALYAKQDTSAKTAQKLAEWFMLDSGVNWLLWLIGNHDAWGDGAAVLKQMSKRYKTKPLEMADWVARFQIEFPNGFKPRIIAAHDFKGHSQWNPLHGPMKEGQMGADADLFVCGHKHNWAIFQWENPGRGMQQTFIRTRGYKFMDEYARRGMFPEQSSGCSVMSVIDPNTGIITPFENLEDGAKFLTSLREA